MHHWSSQSQQFTGKSILIKGRVLSGELKLPHKLRTLLILNNAELCFPSDQEEK